jgi:hypothetical protein
MVIARAEPVAIYDFPLFLVMKPDFQSQNLKRRLPRRPGLLAMTYLFIASAAPTALPCGLWILLLPFTLEPLDL